MNNRYGIIYKVTNLINNKIYIGQTVKKINERRNGHYYKARKELDNTHTKFLNALRKYAEEDFLWEEIDSADSAEELNEKELYWIGFYDSVQSGYNTRIGGDGRIDTDVFSQACGSKYFLMYDHTGEFIGRFINKREVERNYGVNHSDISQILLNKSQRTRNFSNGFTFFNEGEKDIELKLQERIKKYNMNKGIYKPFYAIQRTTGLKFGPFTQKAQAKKELNIPCKKLSEILQKKTSQKSESGYIFCYEEELKNYE